MNLNVSPEAVQHLKSDLDGRMLRIAFTTGCGGSGYRLGYAEGANDGDRIVRIGEIEVALDDMAASRLEGATITWDSEEDGYLLDHPDAVNVAWCG